MRKKKVIVIIALVLLGAGLTVFLFTRDSGLPVVVEGNLSAKDVAQIKSVVRRELWRESLPNFSQATIKALPQSIRRVRKVQVVRISCFSWINGTQLARVAMTESHEPGWSQLPYGPGGWAFYQKYIRD